MKKFFLRKPFFLTATCLSAIAVLLRFIELGTNIEEHTGFYKNPHSFSRIAFIIVLALGFISGILLLYLIKKKANLPINLGFDLKPFFSERILLGAVAVGFAVNSFYEFFRLANPLTTLTFQRGNQTFAVLTTIFSALCLFLFIFLCFLPPSEKIYSSLAPAILVVWSLFRILRDFVSFTTILYVSKNLLDIIYVALLTITLFSFCRIISDADRKKGFKTFTILAPITIIMGLAISVPSILGFICGFDCVGESDMFMYFVDLTLSVFLLRFSMHLYSEK